MTDRERDTPREQPAAPRLQRRPQAPGVPGTALPPGRERERERASQLVRDAVASVHPPAREAAEVKSSIPAALEASIKVRDPGAWAKVITAIGAIISAGAGGGAYVRLTLEPRIDAIEEQARKAEESRKREVTALAARAERLEKVLAVALCRQDTLASAARRSSFDTGWQFDELEWGSVRMPDAKPKSPPIWKPRHPCPAMPAQLPSAVP